ncbi:MAG: outer membrane lipoprotein carrier protein LolA [Bacteroidales bacterium]|jgi:outer membrane lipoprotein-sorting protein|nr:outer membrane lipoprotein carrier protein LolA [Bacteroidales bacterium]
MVKNYFLLGVFTLCSLVAEKSISRAGGDTVVEKIKAANAKYTSISGKFKQTRHVSVLGKDIVSTGMLYYEKPDKLAMHYDDPSGDLMLINGDQFVMINAGKRQEASSKSNAKMRGMKTILSACLQGDINQIGSSKITAKETSQYHVITVEIDAKTNKSNIRSVVLSFDKSNLSLSVLRTEEPNGSYTIYELTNKQFDKKIDASVFISPKNKQK